MKVSEWQSRFNKKFPHKATVELKNSEYRKWQEVPTPAQIHEGSLEYEATGMKPKKPKKVHRHRYDRCLICKFENNPFCETRNHVFVPVQYCRCGAKKP